MVAKITYPDATVSEYRYDGGGRRIESVEDNRITKFLYDGLNAAIRKSRGVAAEKMKSVLPGF